MYAIRSYYAFLIGPRLGSGNIKIGNSEAAGCITDFRILSQVADPAENGGSECFQSGKETDKRIDPGKSYNFV